MDTATAHAAATLCLVGLIWNVQLVQYPAFALVGGRELRAYHAAHCRRITWIVAPLMGIEGLCALRLAFAPPAHVSALALWCAGLLLAINVLSTALVFVPLHGRLIGPERDEVQRRLVRANWVRTLAWTARGGLALHFLG